MKLLPGMTADLTFLIEEKEDVLRVPKAALRYYPERSDLVHPDDRDILEGAKRPDRKTGRPSRSRNSKSTSEKPTSTDAQLERRQKRRNRHVWVQEGEFLRAISVKIGLSDDMYSEVLESELEEDQELVIGVEKK